jgi:hypothetical protein
MKMNQCQIQSSNEMQKLLDPEAVQTLVRQNHNVVLNLGLMKIRLVSESDFEL